MVKYYETQTMELKEKYRMSLQGRLNQTRKMRLQQKFGLMKKKL